LVMHTLWLRQSAALKGSHRCLILPCFYAEHDLRLCNSGFGSRLRSLSTHLSAMADDDDITDGQAAFVSGIVDRFQSRLQSIAASMMAAQQKLSADVAALVERTTVLEAAVEDGDAEVLPPGSLSGLLPTNLIDWPPLPSRADELASVDGVQPLQLPPDRAVGPAPVDSSRLLRPPSVHAIGPAPLDGSRLIDDWQPTPAGDVEPVPGDGSRLMAACQPVGWQPTPAGDVEPVPGDGSRLMQPPLASAVGPVQEHGSRLLAGCQPAPAGAARPAPVVGLQLLQPPETNVPPVARVGPVVPIKDILSTIDMFYGNANKHALVLDDEYLVPFQRWFQSAVWKLKTGGVSAQQLVPLLCQRLSGPVLNALMDRQAIEGFDLATLSLDAFRAKLSGMFADAEAKFTQLALDMRFRPAQLATDLNTFRTYLAHSSLTSSLDTEFVFSLVRSKLNAAYPNCLLIAQTEFQLTLNPADGFQVFMDTAVTLAQRLQQRKRARDAGAVDDAPTGPETRRRTRTPTRTPPSRSGAGPSRRPAATFEAAETPVGAVASKFEALLSVPWKRLRADELKLLGRFATPEQLTDVFHRCARCAHFQQPGFEEHDKLCISDCRRGRITAMRKTLLAGGIPNREQEPERTTRA
jgi:hypothetical protein